MITKIRGTKDILPEQSVLWQHIEEVAAQVFANYGYRQIRTPIIESQDLFCRSLGESTDIINKEMYAFPSRKGEMLALRPEGTASVVRAAIENHLTQGQKLWYQGAMFRYERPQKGRQRQFHQIGAEALGFSGADVELETILLTQRLWSNLGIDGVTLEINSVGSDAARSVYRQALVKYFKNYKNDLDNDSVLRLETNPLRILDSKNPDMHNIIADAPKIQEFFDSESRQRLDNICQLLDNFAVDYRLNPLLVRGLDYYQHTVFEWLSDDLGSQSAVCGGGRYNHLVEQLGGKQTSAFGFAIGVERLLLLMKQKCFQLDVYLIADEQCYTYAINVAEKLRSHNIRVLVSDCSASFKSQFKKADKSGASYAMIIGTEEKQLNEVTIKNLRRRIEQQRMALDQAIISLTQTREEK